MTTPASYSKTPPSMRTEALAQRIYWTKTSFVAVHFDKAGKGSFVNMPEGVRLRVRGSSRLTGCVEVRFEKQTYHVFRVDLLLRSRLNHEPLRTKDHATPEGLVNPRRGASWINHSMRPNSLSNCSEARSMGG
jgi:hypothetical protein